MNICPVAPPRLWLVRHGESSWNARGLVQGQAAAPGLSRAGRRQARACARELALEPVTSLFSSDLARAVETAQPIAEVLGLPVALDERLRERALGTAEGTPAALLPAAQSGVEAGRVVDADAAPPGGESVRQLYDRATAFLAELFAHDAGGDVVLVSHGGVVRVLEAWLDGTGPDEMAWPEVGHAHPVVRHVPAPGGSGVRRKEARCT